MHNPDDMFKKERKKCYMFYFISFKVIGMHYMNRYVHCTMVKMYILRLTMHFISWFVMQACLCHGSGFQNHFLLSCLSHKTSKHVKYFTQAYGRRRESNVHILDGSSEIGVHTYGVKSVIWSVIRRQIWKVISKITCFPSYVRTVFWTTI